MRRKKPVVAWVFLDQTWFFRHSCRNSFGHKTCERKTLKFFVLRTRSCGAFQARREPLYGHQQEGGTSLRRKVGTTGQSGGNKCIAFSTQHIFFRWSPWKTGYARGKTGTHKNIYAASGRQVLCAHFVQSRCVIE